jgi:hypothetical protein
MSDDIDGPTVMTTSPKYRDGDSHSGQQLSPIADAKAESAHHSGERRYSSSKKLTAEDGARPMSRQDSLAAKALDREAEALEMAAAAASSSESDAKGNL